MTWDEREAARKHWCFPAGVAKHPLARGSKEPLRVRHPTTRRLGRRTLYLLRTKQLLRVCRRGKSVGIDLTWEVGGCLMVGWGDVTRTQGRDMAVGRAVVPVRVSVHGGESELTNSPTVFIPAQIHFPELQHRVQQNKPKFVGPSRFTPLPRSSPSPLIPICPSLPCPVCSDQRSPPSSVGWSYLVPRRAFADESAVLHLRKRGGGNDLQGVVSICSPVNTAFAPAIKHIICSDSLSVCRPAARRTIVLGRTIRAVATVRSTVGSGTG
jgi:hypothetical protein